MEQTENPAPESNNPNGFVNRVFNVSLDVENKTSSVYIQDKESRSSKGLGENEDDPPHSPVKERQEVSRRPRATGGIWKILNRKRAVSELERRPHSMILPGQASIPKLSFADKVRSFKKLKSPSVFRGKATKLSSAKYSSSLVDEESFCHEIGTPQQSGRGTLRHRGKRHSYAGYTAEFDCSLEDVDFTAPIDGNQLPVTGEALTQNGYKAPEKVCYTKRSQTNSINQVAAGSEEPSIKCTPSSHQGRGRRHKDVWSYLRRISLLGKANPVYSERSFDSELHSLDKTLDSDYGSVDLESVRDFPPLPPRTSDTKGHFSGLFRFFNSVANTARKWRTTSHTFSPPAGERTQMSPSRAPQHSVDNIHSVSLTLHNEALPKSVPIPSSPETLKSPHSSSIGNEAASSMTGEQSPTVVLKAFRACPGHQAVNGLHSFNSTDEHIAREMNHCPTAMVENHILSLCQNTDNKQTEVRGDQLNYLCQEENLKGQTGNEQDSSGIQSQQANKESTANSLPASNSTEEIFKVCDFKYLIGIEHRRPQYNLTTVPYICFFKTTSFLCVIYHVLPFAMSIFLCILVYIINTDSGMRHVIVSQNKTCVTV